MDPNNTNQDQTASQQSDTPTGDAIQQNPTQNDTTVQTDTSTPVQETSDSPVAVEQEEPVTAEQSDPNSMQSTDVTQTTPTTEPNQAVAPASIEGSYIEDVGEDLIDLLDEINEDENLTEAVAKEMRLDKESVKAILAKLLAKIDQGQITEDELALIMASTVADEVLDEA